MVDVLNAAGTFPATSEVCSHHYFYFMRLIKLFTKVVIAVPSIHIAAAKASFRPDIAVSAEDVCIKKGYGAYTGEISAEMLADSGIKWTLTGHSERRVGFGFPVSYIF